MEKTQIRIGHMGKIGAKCTGIMFEEVTVDGEPQEDTDALGLRSIMTLNGASVAQANQFISHLRASSGNWDEIEIREQHEKSPPVKGGDFPNGT